MMPLREIFPNHNSGRAEYSPAAREDSEPAAQSCSSTTTTRKRPQTRIACTPCRRRKSKCDGRRPVCTTCAAAGLQECEYDGDPDLTRAAALRKRNDELQRRVALYEELFTQLSGRSEEVSLDILRRIRRANLRTDPEELVRFINDGEVLVELSSTGAAKEPDEGLPPAAVEDVVASDQITAVPALLRKAYVDRLGASSKPCFLDAFKVQLDQMAHAETPDYEAWASSTTPPSTAVSIISDSNLPSFQIRRHL